MQNKRRDAEQEDKRYADLTVRKVEGVAGGQDERILALRIDIDSLTKYLSKLDNPYLVVKSIEVRGIFFAR